MFIRRVFTRQRARTKYCAQCHRIRLFLFAATSLILALFFVDQNESPLAGLTPMKIAFAMMLLGSAGFVLRVLDHLLDAKRPKVEGEISAQTTNQAHDDPLEAPKLDA